MSEEIPAILAESPTVEAVAHGLGTALRSARESLGMDVDDAARKLCLSPRQLSALESDDFAALPSPAFTRGFIRNYARLLNLDPNPLLERYREIQPQQPEVAAISLQTEGIPIQIKEGKSWIPYLLASILIGVGGGAWMAYMEWSERQAVAVEKPLAAKPVVAATVPTLPQPVPEPTPMASVTEQSSTSAVVATPVSEKGRLAMTFTQQSWLRIIDRDGVEIFSKTEPAGSEDVAEGQPPFKVDIGNAAGVQLSYNGQLVDLTPHTKANVARLTLE